MAGTLRETTAKMNVNHCTGEINRSSSVRRELQYILQRVLFPHSSNVGLPDTGGWKKDAMIAAKY